MTAKKFDIDNIDAQAFRALELSEQHSVLKRILRRAELRKEVMELATSMKTRMFKAIRFHTIDMELRAV